jgi:hypothetical protein
LLLSFACFSDAFENMVRFSHPPTCDSFVSSKTYGGGSVCEALVGDVYDLGLEACHYGLGFEYSCAQTGKYCFDDLCIQR